MVLKRWDTNTVSPTIAPAYSQEPAGHGVGGLSLEAAWQTSSDE